MLANTFMSLQTSGAKPNTKAYCDDRHRLLNEYTKAVQELGSLQEQQVSALVKDDSDGSRFDVLIYRATEAKKLAKDAYIAHVRTHDGCQ